MKKLVMKITLALTMCLTIVAPIAIRAQQATPESVMTYVDSLLGEDLEATDVKVTGDQLQFSTFAGKSNLPFSDGFVISTGNANEDSVFKTYTSTSKGMSGHFGNPGDDKLTQAYQALGASDITFDAASIEFSVVPTTDTISFTYFLASTEYNQPVEYNDLFALEINGENVAKMDDGSVVSIQTTKNSNYYVANQYENALNFMGYTKQMVCSGKVTPNEPTTIRIVIADAADTALDTAVFIKAGGVSSMPPVITPVEPLSQESANVVIESPKTSTTTMFYMCAFGFVAVLLCGIISKSKRIQ